MGLFRDTQLPEVFEALHALTEAQLLTWIAQMLAARRARHDPLELLQDTYVNIYRYAASFREERGNTFRGWARTIAANVVRRASMRPLGALSIEALPRGPSEPVDERPGPGRSAVLSEERSGLASAWLLFLLHYAAAFEKLSARDREALHMVEVEGISYVEAGERLSVGRSNMKMIVFRARKRLRMHILCKMLERGSAAEAVAA